MSLAENPEWLAWLDERPPAIRALAEEFPPWQVYEVQGGINPAQIVSYEEGEDGEVGFRCRINDPFMPREVFGLKRADVKPWPEGKTLDPWGTGEPSDEHR